VFHKGGNQSRQESQSPGGIPLRPPRQRVAKKEQNASFFKSDQCFSNMHEQQGVRRSKS